MANIPSTCVAVYRNTNGILTWTYCHLGADSSFADKPWILAKFKNKEELKASGFPMTNHQSTANMLRDRERWLKWHQAIKSQPFLTVETGEYKNGVPILKPVYAAVIPTVNVTPEDPSARRDREAMMNRKVVQTHKPVLTVERPFCPLQMLTPVNAWGRPFNE